ncbi:MAG: hypothetical protein GX862_09925 [Leucobacter sp.]|nr:hypothetical protein [Leucobacter sp.]
MSDSATPKKKVVKVEPTKAAAASGTQASEGAKGDRVWSPTPEAKSKATKLRIFAWVGWLLAIGVEAIAIFVLLRQNPVNMWLLIGAIVVTGALAITGSLLWKKANDLDPASKSNAVRFFIQNQLGAIMTIIAFLPLIILIFTNKNMDGKQKALAGTIGIVVAIAAVAVGIDWNPSSQEQYAEEEHIMLQLTGKDEVFWVKGGSVFHVCAEVPDVNRESADGQIYQGTVADAHAAGKSRLVSYWDREALNYCGYSQEQVDAVKAGISAPAAETTDTAADDTNADDATTAGDASADEAADDEADSAAAADAAESDS